MPQAEETRDCCFPGSSEATTGLMISQLPRGSRHAPPLLFRSLIHWSRNGLPPTLHHRKREEVRDAESTVSE